MIDAKDEAPAEKASHRWWRCHHQPQSQSQRIVVARSQSHSPSLHFHAPFSLRRFGSEPRRRRGAKRGRRFQFVAGGGVSDATRARNQRLRFRSPRHRRIGPDRRRQTDQPRLLCFPH